MEACKFKAMHLLLTSVHGRSVVCESGFNPCLALVDEKGVVRVTEFLEFVTKYHVEKYDAIFS